MLAYACSSDASVDMSVKSNITSAIQNVQNCCGLRRSRRNWDQLAGGD
jgi:hypothetical protein